MAAIHIGNTVRHKDPASGERGDYHGGRVERIEGRRARVRWPRWPRFPSEEQVGDLEHDRAAVLAATSGKG
jgi:hypothetical protein